MGVPERCQCPGSQTERGGLDQDPLGRITSLENPLGLWLVGSGCRHCRVEESEQSCNGGLSL